MNLDPQTASLVKMLAGATAIVPPPDNKYPVPVAEAFYQAAALVADGEKSSKDALVWLDDTVKAMGNQQ